VKEVKIITIVGARPQFIKAAMVSRAIIKCRQSGYCNIEEKILHTGQHYDANMSSIFFDDLNIPSPTWQLQSDYTSHAQMTAHMLVEIERILTDEHPDYVLVYGDTNSTLSGALAAAKLHIPVVHVEAGLRSFNKQMPEEINRVLTDHMADILFCPTFAAVQNLKNENITGHIYHVGDVMYDAALSFGKLAEKTSVIIPSLQLTPKQFYLCTVHRAENTDNRERLTGIIRAMIEIATPDYPVILPLHPRTRNCFEKYQLSEWIHQNPGLKLIDPLNYLDMVMLEKQAATIFTDSGGIQKEAYFHRTPCITLREETEWVETIGAGWNQLAGYQTANILSCLNRQIPKRDIGEYGDGHASDKIVEHFH
jgi:UDP-GlcNAc3NAcA epimerase